LHLFSIKTIKKEVNCLVKIIKLFRIYLSLTVLLAILSLSACLLRPSASILNAEALSAFPEDKIGKSSHVILVTTNNSFFFTEQKVRTLEKHAGIWETVFEPFNAVIGKNGFAQPGEKREGDGKTPSGIYPLKMTFGYDESIKTKMPYRQVLADDIWVDDVNADDYNRWVKKGATQAKSYEKMRRDDSLYKYGIVIEYNTRPVVKGYGSAIFFHVWGGADITTGGCVAVSEENIIKILLWLDPQAEPLIIMGIEDATWRLP
jgi:L,D-peptidoglycan transpeptidase YkuD (ErfK/YbiS/YcfS/YnhG family)